MAAIGEESDAVPDHMLSNRPASGAAASAWEGAEPPGERPAPRWRGSAARASGPRIPRFGAMARTSRWHRSNRYERTPSVRRGQPTDEPMAPARGPRYPVDVGESPMSPASPAPPDAGAGPTTNDGPVAREPRDVSRERSRWRDGRTRSPASQSSGPETLAPRRPLLFPSVALSEGGSTEVVAMAFTRRRPGDSDADSEPLGADPRRTGLGGDIYIPPATVSVSSIQGDPFENLSVFLRLDEPPPEPRDKQFSAQFLEGWYQRRETEGSP